MGSFLEKTSSNTMPDGTARAPNRFYQALQKPKEYELERCTVGLVVPPSYAKAQGILIGSSSFAQLFSLFHRVMRKPKGYLLGAQVIHSCSRCSTTLWKSPGNTCLELKRCTVVLVVPWSYAKAQGILMWRLSDAQLCSLFHQVMQKPKEYLFGAQAVHSWSLWYKKQWKIAKTDVQYLSCVHAASCWQLVDYSSLSPLP